VTMIPSKRWMHVARRCMNNALLQLPPVAELNAIRAAGRTGSMNDPDYLVAILGTHLRRLQQHGGSIDGIRALELGPGNSLGQGVLLGILGAECVTAVDVAPFADERTGRAVYGPLADRVEDLVESGALPNCVSAEERSTRTSAVVPNGSHFPRLGGRLHYEITDGRHLPSPDDSVDFIYSCSVLEHVKDPKLAYAEMARVLRPDGFLSHMIDLEDHCHPDPYDFLRYGDRLWSLMQSRSPGFTNRLRASDHLRLMERAGMEVLETVHTKAESPPQSRGLSRRFREYEPEDLMTIRMAVFARKRAESPAAH
jgi:SAM-dependent methyltransferase